MKMSRACAVTLGSLTLVVMGVGPASAGEVTGHGTDTQGPAHANSICVFSGHNDDPTAPLDGSGPNGPGGQSQSYGQENRLGLVDPHQLNPGDACRGGSNFARQ